MRNGGARQGADHLSLQAEGTLDTDTVIAGIVLLLDVLVALAENHGMR